jgi:hypothetical protein
VVIFAAERAIHVDEVNPACARSCQLGERLQRIGQCAMGARDAPACYVDGGIELHRVDSRTLA